MKLKDLPPPPATLNGVLRWLTELVRLTAANNAEIQAAETSYIAGREQYVGHEWVDETPVFQLTIPVTEVFCTTNAQTIAHGIPDFDELVDLGGRFKDGSTCHTLPYIGTTSQIGISVDGTNIKSIVGGTPSFSSFSDGYVTIWYTKI